VLPTMRTEAPRPLPPPKNDRSRTISPEQKKSPKQNEKEEMTILKQYIDFLSQERVLLKDERAAMMQERKRLMEEERQRQREFLDMQY
jgi:hypothetical protein